jgi:hypothetical protein
MNVAFFVTFPVTKDYSDKRSITHELAISDSFRSKRSADLKATAFGEGSLGFVVNGHTVKPRRVTTFVSESCMRHHGPLAIYIPDTKGVIE